MEIKKLTLSNIGRFKDLEIDLAPTLAKQSSITVLVGNNGAGKTTLLQSLATSLSWLVARIRTEKGNGNHILEDWISNDASSSTITIEVLDNSDQNSSPNNQIPTELFKWSLKRVRRGRKTDLPSELSAATKLASTYRTRLTNDDLSSLPLIAFYPVERSVLEIPLKIRTRHTFGQLDGYDNSLNRGVDFRRFFEWFREREDSENESGFSTSLLSVIEKLAGKESQLWHELTQLNASARDRQLTAVRTAIEKFMPGFRNLRIQRKPRLHMAIDKEDVTLNVSQLSQGEKSLMALIGDIARRLAMMNPALENPLLGDGIILIDEVDLHLHPKWQLSLISRLSQTFPYCQFVLTTHSPLVISDSKEILCYSLDENGISPIENIFGMDANQVLLSVMDADIRNKSIQESIDRINNFIQDGNLPQARNLFGKLQNELPSNSIELAKIQLLLKKVELSREKNRKGS